ncbi:MAG: gamma carbonic anhydrase family protein [Deltaproteobacteria bacterium]|nr:gamma carbonic anhydrase family protein [Deltaproteobacteria bacterium]
MLPFRGKTPSIDPSAYLAPTASVIGDVVIGPRSSIWFGAVVRGDVFHIRIGAGTNIQDNCVVHVTHDRSATIVGDDCTVGHGAVLHGCAIGDRVLVGIGSVILDDAEVASDVLVGAGSLVTIGTKVPPRSLVLGRPARVVRSLTDEEVAGLAEAARLYVDFRGEYLGA